MDFRFRPEEERFRQEVREFLKQELSPDWEDQFDPETKEGADAAFEFGRQFTKKLAQRRWLAMHWPKQYGGLEATLWQQIVYQEELAYANAPETFSMGVAWVGPALTLFGSDEQKQQHLPAIVNHDELWCTLYSEPGAGSDLASLRTRAVRQGDEWVINGQKIWTSLGHRADWGWLAARTDPDAPKHKGISMFVVPMRSSGLTVRPLINMTNLHQFNEVFFEGVRIPASYLVGEENRGWYQLAVALDFERSSIAGNVVRVWRAWRDIVDFACENPSFVQLNPTVRHRLAQMGIEVEAGRLLSYRVASMQQAGKIPSREAAMAKLVCAELNQKVARTGMELLGLYGQLHPNSGYAPLRGRIERYYLESVARTIGGGTSEIMRNVIATRGLGLPRD